MMTAACYAALVEAFRAISCAMVLNSSARARDTALAASRSEAAWAVRSSASKMAPGLRKALTPGSALNRSYGVAICSWG